MVWSREKGIRLRLMAAAAVLTLLITVSAVSWAEPHPGVELLTLAEALNRAAEKHPLVSGAQGAEESKALALARSQAVYAPRLSLSLKPVTLSAEEKVEVQLADSAAVNGGLSTLQGLDLSASNRWDAGGREGKGLRVQAQLQLWPPARCNGDYLRLLSAEEAVELSAYKYSQARQEAVIDIYSRYRMLQIEEARLKLQQDAYEANQAAYERAVGKAEQGLASAVEVLAAQQAKEESLAEYRRAARDYRIKLKAFLADLSLEGEAWELEPLPDALGLPDVDITLEEAVAMAYGADLALMEQSQALAAAQRQLEAVRAANGIELSLGANASFSEEQSWDGRYEAYLSFSYPVFDGGIRQLDVKEAELNLQSAQKAVDQRRLEVGRAVESKLSEIQYLADMVRIADLKYEKAALEHNAKVLQAANGLIPESEAKESQRLLAGARLSWLEAAAALEKARLELRSMTGQAVDVEGGHPN